MNGPKIVPFDPIAFLASVGLRHAPLQLRTKQVLFRQGDPADCLFFLQEGRAKLTVVSQAGKEATITLLIPGDFIGEEAVAGRAGGRRMTTATALTACTVLRLDKSETVRCLHENRTFSDYFLRFLLARSMRTQADLIDQLFNSSEKRLARILLLMAELGRRGETATLIPPITQQTLAEMIGTTRSRVSFFMNRFRKFGFVQYNGRIRVHKSLLNVVLHDDWQDRAENGSQLPEPPGQEVLPSAAGKQPAAKAQGSRKAARASSDARQTL